MKIHPSAVPLITCDPYFSVWSTAARLNEGETRHWSGAVQPLRGYVMADGVRYRFLGLGEGQAMEQVSLEITPLSTIYLFWCPAMRLKVTFTTPLLLDDLALLARPVTYLTVEVQLLQAEKVTLVLEVEDDITLRQRGQQDTVFQQWSTDTLCCGSVGGKVQQPLGSWGDLVSIDWGYFYLATSQAGGSVDGVESRNPNGTVHHTLRLIVPLAGDEQCVTALGYDDLAALNYFQQQLPPYWHHETDSMVDLCKKALLEYPQIMRRCANFDQQLTTDAQMAGGADYAELLALAYRQSIAAHRLCEDEKGQLLFVSKECGSGACAATADVSYPSMPLFLLYRPELVEAMMQPIFRYDASPVWPHPYAPHDAGYFPLLNGQVYSNGTEPDRQMPVEECGNLLMMTAACALARQNTDFFRAHRKRLTDWYNYLLQNGADPGNQLCTDDFAGHMAHNCNLAIKAILGIAAFGLLCGLDGDRQQEADILNTARVMAKDWVRRAAKPDGTFKLAFDQEDTFSLKYNAVWDGLFETRLFAPHTFDQELESYRTVHRNLYGTPLDNRAPETKSDWLCWCAAMDEDPDHFEQMLEPLLRAYDQADIPMALGDWYSTVTARPREFQNRSVQGGLFIRMLTARGLRPHGC